MLNARRIFLMGAAILWIIPLLILLALGFSMRGPYGAVAWQFSLESWGRLNESLYWGVLARSLVLAGVTSLGAVVLATPLAYEVARSKGRRKTVLFFLATFPFWVNFIVRVYGSKELFSMSEAAVFFSMISNYLPFAFLPLYLSFDRLDWSLEDAAKDLGASEWAFFWKILVLSRLPAFALATFMVFTPALGEFVIPDLVGGAKVSFAGNLVNDFFLKSRDWPMGAVFGALLVLVSVFTFFLSSLVSQKEEALR